ncbi:transglutaminase-like cysteine peptidase [Asticcacaulis solisilvae]|uniref:transglutaminase-like cysteine peptidase n=1 Tax=Asticcacaulis solisilvae TaxID=1217274 RepID=UPI003FD81FB2
MTSAVVAAMSLMPVAASAQDTSHQDASSPAATPAEKHGVEGLIYPQAAPLATADTPKRPPFQIVGDHVASPIGFLEMCQRTPDACAHWPDSDLAAIKAGATEMKLAQFREAFAKKLASRNSHDTVLKVGQPSYLNYDWVTIEASADDSVYVWPTPVTVAHIRDAMSQLSLQVADMPLQVLYIPASLRRTELDTASQSAFTGARPHLEQPRPTGWLWPEVSSLVTTVGLSEPDQPARHSFRQQVDLQLGPGLDETPVQHASAQDAPAAPQTPPASPQAEAPVAAPADDTAPIYPRVDLTPSQYQVLTRINSLVNRVIRPTTDMAYYHVEDYWVAPGLADGVAGDCEDYALEKWTLLRQQGFPAAAMSLALVSVPDDKRHVILIVTTTDGDYILDNLSTWVKPWTQTYYSWMTRQGPDDDLKWFSLLPTEKLK